MCLCGLYVVVCVLHMYAWYVYWCVICLCGMCMICIMWRIVQSRGVYSVLYMLCVSMWYVQCSQCQCVVWYVYLCVSGVSGMVYVFMLCVCMWCACCEVCVSGCIEQMTQFCIIGVRGNTMRSRRSRVRDTRIHTRITQRIKEVKDQRHRDLNAVLRGLHFIPRVIWHNWGISRVTNVLCLQSIFLLDTPLIVNQRKARVDAGNPHEECSSSKI